MCLIPEKLLLEAMYHVSRLGGWLDCCVWGWVGRWGDCPRPALNPGEVAAGSDVPCECFVCLGCVWGWRAGEWVFLPSLAPALRVC